MCFYNEILCENICKWQKNYKEIWEMFIDVNISQYMVFTGLSTLIYDY